MDYSFNAPAFEIIKSYRGDSGEMFIEGVASTTGIDLTGERMSSEAIAKMAAKLPGLPLRDEHEKGWYDKLGEIVKAEVVDDNGAPALWIKARLYDWSSKARDLFRALTQEGIKLGLSVAGKIHPGGLVKELAEGVGKFIPTYHDVDPTEVSVTDHPANLDTFAIAVSKSMKEEVTKMDAYNPDEYAKDVTNAHESKPSEYKDVPSDKFLDPENYKYPVDEAHLMPALRYFNHDGQRSKGGYSADKWAEMGRKLARLLGEGYSYDAESEKVVKETKKQNGEEVSEMDKGKLVSKKVSPEVLDLVKGFNPAMGEKLEGEIRKVVDSNVDVRKDDSAVASTVSGSSASDSDSSTTGSSTTSTDKADSTATGSTSTGTTTVDSASLSSALSELMSTVKELQSSLSGSTSTDKAAESTESTDSDDSASLKEACDSMQRAMDTLKQIMQKRQSSTASTGSTTEPATASSDSLSKSVKELASVVAEMKKSMADLNANLDQPKERKGYAVVVEKKFDGTEKAAPGVDLDTLIKDPEISFNELHAFRTYGHVPAKYAKQA